MQGGAQKSTTHEAGVASASDSSTHAVSAQSQHLLPGPPQLQTSQTPATPNFLISQTRATPNLQPLRTPATPLSSPVESFPTVVGQAESDDPIRQAIAFAEPSAVAAFILEQEAEGDEEMQACTNALLPQVNGETIN
jgi:hypothetical protein